MKKIILPIYYKLERKTKKDKIFLVGMNRYRNAHFFEANKVKKYFNQIIKYQIPKGLKYKKIKPKYTLYIKNKKTDGGNVIALMEKFLLDSLTENGVIENDTCDIVTGTAGSDYLIDIENPRCEVFLEERFDN